jgi:hypothetical protein
MNVNWKRAGGWIAIAIIAAATGGCGNKQSGKPASEQLQQSFEKADTTIKQEVSQVGSAFQAGNYTHAITLMDRVVQTQSRPIDDTQKRAVDALIIQTRQAAQQNPKLNTPELYKAMNDLMVRVHGEN